jgi:spore coat protein CotH
MPNRFSIVLLVVAAILVLKIVDTRADDAACFFDDTIVHEIHMTFDDENWYDTLFGAHASGNDDFYLFCKWEYINGTNTITLDPVGARFKGHSSFFDSGIKKSFKIDFNEMIPDQEFLGLKKLNLNNNFRDPTMLREKLFLDFVGERGLVHRAVFANVYINGELWGVFTVAEQVDATFRSKLFGENDDGNLYKGEYQADLNYLGEDPESYYAHYELKTNETTNDWSGLIHFVDLLNNTSDEDFTHVIKEIIDYDSLIRHLAANILFINFDSYIGPAHNFYVYHREDSGRFVHLIWDCNMAFGNYWQPFSPDYNMVEAPLLWSSAEGNGRPLAERIWNDPVLVRDFYRALARMLRNGFSSGTMDARIDTLADLIRSDVYADPYKEYTNEEFEQALSVDLGSAVGLKRFVSDRRVFVKNELDSVAVAGDMRLNELMTVNTDTMTDEAGDHDPWMEIFNPGPGLADTSDLYLTDDHLQPAKWQLPVVALEDAEFTIIWLDGETGEGINHASFRPDPTGGNLFLYWYHQSEYQLIDSVVYQALSEDTVWGRWPDGTGEWNRLDSPSPESENSRPDLPEMALVINEVMASNDSSYTDDSGEYEDWLEIFNGGTEPVNLDGLYLTDTLFNPTKHMLPDLILNPGEYMVFFCDEEIAEGDRHTNFKLLKCGESVGLFCDDGVSMIDSVTYPELETDISYSRCPDGGATWVFQPDGTPGESNNSACSNGMTLEMDDVDLQEGDLFHLYFTLGPQDSAMTMDAYVILGVGDLFWCWPSWIAIGSGLDYTSYDIPAWDTMEIDVLNFDWPALEGSASGLVFYGAAFEEGTFNVIGDYQVIEFGYN